MKRTDKYVLINVDGRASAIVNAKFLRKKETEDCVFLSLPPDYKVGCRVREYDAETGKWNEVKKFELKPTSLKYSVTHQKDDLPF